MATNIEELAERLAGDQRIATPTLHRILNDIDQSIAEVIGAGEPVPAAVQQVREVVAQACLIRRSPVTPSPLAGEGGAEGDG
jgi:hypothetical protein